MKKFIGYPAFLTGAVMLMTGLPVHADAVQNIVIIGDSVSLSLKSGEKSYADLVRDYTRAEVLNFAQAGYNTADLLTALDTPEIQNALSQADVIVVSIGLHDIMDDFLVTANGFMTQFGFVKFTDVFTAGLQEHGFSSDEELIPYANQLADAVSLHKDSAAANTKAITEKLVQYQNAEIIYQTAYNLLDNIEMYSTLSQKRQMAYNSILNPTKSVLNESINNYLNEFASAHENFHTADIFTAFQGMAYEYTNLYDLELNPSAAGHAKIAETVIASGNLSRLGDVNGDNLINAADAGQVLKYAADTGAGHAGAFSDSQQKAADVDHSQNVTSQDAAQILVCASAIGSGKDCQFRKVSDAVLVDPDPVIPGEELTDPDPTSPDESQLTDPDPVAPM